MHKKTKENLKWIVKSILEDNEYVKFEKYLHNDQWTSLRLLMADITERYDLRVMLEQNTLSELIELQDVEAVVIDADLGIYEDPNEERLNEEGEVRIRLSRNS